MRLTKHHFTTYCSGNSIRNVFLPLFAKQVTPAVSTGSNGFYRKQFSPSASAGINQFLFAQGSIDNKMTAQMYDNTLRQAFPVSGSHQLAVVIPFNAENQMPLSRRPVAKFAKRALDFAVSLLVIIFILSWLLPIIGILIRLESKGPVLFKQLRSGLDGRKFWCYKFRSMVVNRDADEKQAVSGDTRITKIGAILRKTSLDELPQFLNILTGDMTLVGPRPHMLKHTAYYGECIPGYMERLKVKQGLTGWAQVHGYRGETTELHLMQARVEHDNWYISNWSFLLDIRILLMTVFNLFKTDEKAR